MCAQAGRGFDAVDVEGCAGLHGDRVAAGVVDDLAHPHVTPGVDKDRAVAGADEFDFQVVGFAHADAAGAGAAGDQRADQRIDLDRPRGADIQPLGDEDRGFVGADRRRPNGQRAIDFVGADDAAAQRQGADDIEAHVVGAVKTGQAADKTGELEAGA